MQYKKIYKYFYCSGKVREPDWSHKPEEKRSTRFPATTTFRKYIMKVLKGPEIWTKECYCIRCKSELEIDINDLKVGYFSPNCVEAPYVTCPICNNPITFYWGSVPLQPWDNLKCKNVG